MSLAYDLLGLVFGILGTIGIFQMVYSWLLYSFPTQKLKDLDNIMVETNALFHNVVEQGLLPDASFVTDTENNLLSIRTTAEEMRAKVHCATTFRKQFRAWLAGLSRRISDLCREIEELRAEISTTSDKERRRLESEGRFTRPSLLAPVVPGATPQTLRSLIRPRRNAPFRLGYTHLSSSALAPEVPATTETPARLTYRVARPPAAVVHSSPMQSGTARRPARTNLLDSSHNSTITRAADESPVSQSSAINLTNTDPNGAEEGPVVNIGTLFQTLVQLSDTVTNLASVVEVRPPDFEAIRAGLREGSLSSSVNENGGVNPTLPVSTAHITEMDESESLVVAVSPPDTAEAVLVQPGTTLEAVPDLPCSEDSLPAQAHHTLQSAASAVDTTLVEAIQPSSAMGAVSGVVRSVDLPSTDVHRTVQSDALAGPIVSSDTLEVGQILPDPATGTVPDVILSLDRSSTQDHHHAPLDALDRLAALPSVPNSQTDDYQSSPPAEGSKDKLAVSHDSTTDGQRQLVAA